jgi:hypothetical protein
MADQGMDTAEKAQLEITAASVESIVGSICSLSVLVIMYPGKWAAKEFHPNPYSKKIVDWFEGTGTIIGIKRNRIFILSSIHCIPGSKYSFFIKGISTRHQQVPVTLVQNFFVEENNGIDIAIFSCDIRCFDLLTLEHAKIIKWNAPSSFEAASSLWLVHYPTANGTDAVPATHRLENPCFPTVTAGTLLCSDFKSLTIDSTIIATGGSSGGLVVDRFGCIVAVHDSQHDDTPDGKPVSTHRMVKELREIFVANKQLCNLFD